MKLRLMLCTAQRQKGIPEMKAKAWLKYKKVELLLGLFSYFCALFSGTSR